MRSGPIVIAHDGSPSADLAVEEAANLFPKRQALVVTVWEPGPAFDSLGMPSTVLAPLDIRTGLELNRELYERAQSLAEYVAASAREAGLDARGLAVVDDATIGEAIARTATERDAPAIVLGAHGHSVLRGVLIGSTTLEVMKHAPCPVVVVRDPTGPPERHAKGGAR
jgi:nucleotide-binding universal stress UspA family protein